MLSRLQQLKLISPARVWEKRHHLLWPSSLVSEVKCDLLVTLRGAGMLSDCTIHVCVSPRSLALPDIALLIHCKLLFVVIAARWIRPRTEW